MKRNLLWWAGAGMLLSAVTACTEEVETQDLAGELREVTVTAKDFTPEAESRAFSIENNYVSFSWADGDTIGIFPTTGAQAYFPIIAGSEDGNSASFTGGGWALKTSSAYASYYPFVGDFYLNKEAIPVTYVGQKQTGNASMAHLSAYDYMTASATTPTGGKVNFQFSHLNAFVQLKITMPQGGTLSSVTLSADEAVFTTEGTYDLTAATPTITATQKSKTLTLEVEDVTTTAESNVATLYLMLAPVDFTDKTLSAIVKTSDGKSETITLTGKNFKAGGAYGVSGTMKDPNGGVTAGDGTYANGVVSVDVAGNMKSLLGSDYLNITELKVVGPINGDDIYYLRKMLGASSFSEADWGKLTTLDLSEATIVEGGGWYYSQSSTIDYYGKIYTSNDTIGGYMFVECNNLEEIVLPNNVISIEGYAFLGCDNLSSVTIGENVISIKHEAFYYCPSLSSITIPNNVVSIGSRAFAGSGITSATIGNGVVAIENYAFCDCINLNSLNIGNNVKTIGNGAFEGCEKLSTVVIPNSVISMGDNCFKGCGSLNSISIGTGLTSIGYDAFANCIFDNVYINDIKAWCAIEFEPNYYGYYTSNPIEKSNLYINNQLINNLIIPEGISICNGAFSGCKSIVNITAKKIVSIGREAFYGCDSLTTVTISGEENATINKSAFASCQSLSSVYIGNGIDSIASGAFENCEKLAEVSIGENIKNIEEAAFKNVPISKFYSYATTFPSIVVSTSYGSDSFSESLVENATLYVPARCGSSYKLGSWGVVFTNIIEMD